MFDEMIDKINTAMIIGYSIAAFIMLGIILMEGVLP